jgi:starch-binding outer membrane protein, SusD/RagB family
MKRQIIKYSSYILLASALLGMNACKKDYANPNAATQDQVFSSSKGLTGVAVGLQRAYTLGRASSLYNLVTIDGFTTNQLVILNVGNTSEAQLNTGGGLVDGTNTILGGLWATSNKIIYDADLVIAGAEALGDKGFASGLIGYTTIFKALSIGNMSMFWEKVPAGTGSNVSFINRADGFNNAIKAIDKALSAISANAISPAFLTNIPAGIDIVNTLNALKARYALYVGNYTLALTTANLVDLTKKSTLNFDAANLNPIFETATSTNNVYQTIDSTLGLLGSLQPDLADKRVPFYTVLNASAPRFRIGGFAVGTTTPFPIYLPGEITLIKAECYLRQGSPDQGNAIIELNKVITKKAVNDPLGVGADLPALGGGFTNAQLLDQVYRHRCIELYMSGLKLEDMRRFGRPNSERRRNLFPYPFRERDNNPNTPPDPVF